MKHSVDSVDSADIFYHPIRVYYSDTDCGNVVYYANYLRYMEQARSEFFHANGMPLSVMEDRFKVVAVIKKVTARYLAPARLGMLLLASCKPLEYRRATIVIEQNIYMCEENNKPGKQLFEGLAEMTCVDTEKFKPIVVPDEIKSILITAGATEKIRER